jgi:hypothetical protein
MNSTPNPASTADDVLTARADQRLAHAYQQITQADEQLARLTEQMSKLESDGARHPSLVSSRASHGKSVLRGVIGLVLAAGIGAAAFAAQSPYGEPARSMIAQWVPQFVSTSPAQSRPPAADVQASQPSIQLAAAETTPSQPAVPLQTSAQDIAPAPLPPELTQLLQSMAHDIAVVQQGIEELKANQERMFADTARAIEQVKVNQEQSTRVAARPPQKPAEKPPEQDRRAAASAAPTPASPARSPTVANAAHRPPAQPPQAGARSQPIQLQPADQ